MRDLIFRGKRLDNGSWVSSGNLIQFTEGREVFIPDAASGCLARHDEETDDIVELWDARFRKVDPETVGQFTGFRDSAKNRIFEGDILHLPDVHFPDGEVLVSRDALVLWADGGWMLRYSGAETHLLDVLEEDVAQEATIAGNIYDDPQLMEVE